MEGVFNAGDEENKYSFLDRSHLLKVCYNDEDKLQELLIQAIPVLVVNIQKLRRLFQEKKDDEFLRELHQVKGSLGVIEPLKLFPAARELELSYKVQGQQSSVKNFINDLDAFVQELQLFSGGFKR